MIWHSSRNLLALLATVLTVMACAPTGLTQKTSVKPTNGTNIALSRDLSGTLTRARITGKPTIVVFSAVWCPQCKAFEASVLTSPEVRVLVDDFYWVLVNIDRQASVARNYDIDVVPQILLLDANGRLWKRLINVATEQRFRHYLTAFAANLEKTSGATSLQSQTTARQLCGATASLGDVSENGRPLPTFKRNVCTVN